LADAAPIVHQDSEPTLDAESASTRGRAAP
jgi:hypothetical protein